MSTFSGRVRECDWISIDHFGGQNLTSTAFFLSHCHQDHMTGLAEDLFYKYVVANNYSLYCHSTSKILLEANTKYSRLSNYIVAKEYGETFAVTCVQKVGADTPSHSADCVSVNVTFIDAQHCPGSAMMLLEFQSGKTALYTGDLRLIKDDWLSCKALEDSTHRTGFKRIDSFYFDSTFCRKGTEAIPSKEQSKELFLKMVSEWLDSHPDRKVLIWGTSYGQEFLFRAIWEKLGIKCHVSADKFRIYSKLPEYADCITPLATATRVHACTTGINAMDECYEERRQSIVRTTRRKFKPQVFPCGFCRPDNRMVRVIRPSVIWFARQKEKSAIGYDHRFFCRLLYSNHCSFSEIEVAFQLLRPVQAFPNVIDRNKGNEHEEKLMTHLRRYLYDATFDGETGKVICKEEIDVKPILLKRPCDFERPCCSTCVDDGEGQSVTIKKRCVKVETNEIKLEKYEADVTVKQEPLLMSNNCGKCAVGVKIEVVSIQDNLSDTPLPEEQNESSSQPLSQGTIVLSDGD